jgi:hypothetical protein
MSKLFPKKSTKKIDVSFSSIFLYLSRFRVFRSDGSSSSKHDKNVLQKNRVDFFLLFTKKKELFFGRPLALALAPSCSCSYTARELAQATSNKLYTSLGAINKGVFNKF